MNLMDAAGMAVAFVTFVIVVGVGGQILAGLQTSLTTYNSTGGTGNITQSVAYNATGFGLTGVTNLANQSGTIGTVIGASIIIGIVVGAFYFANRQ